MFRGVRSLGALVLQSESEQRRPTINIRKSHAGPEALDTKFHTWDVYPFPLFLPAVLDRDCNRGYLNRDQGLLV